MIEIKLLQPQHINAAKRVMAEVCNEIWKLKPTVEELVQAFNEVGEFADLDNVQAAYFDNGGIFLVLADDEKIVGTGGIKRLDEAVCELKRMWILRDYRAHGWGVKIAHELLQFAQHCGYQKVRLEVYEPPRQERAIAFYQALGFYEIPLYRNSPALLAMEKRLK
ncbi:MAG: GNAT family N-acetyltransferase [Acidobacteria bacterium]|nr:GNAT family N-acetyltransferase [Acidobacteriota bacterium]